MIFLAIVWSIGAVILGLEAGMMALAGFGAGRFYSVLPRQSPAASAHCRAVLGSLPPAPRDLRAANRARYLAWKLGNEQGVAEWIRSGGGRGFDVAAFGERCQAVTKALAIPAMTLPQRRHEALAFAEFVNFLEEDPACTAGALESRYSPQHAAMYKFGAIVALAHEYQVAVPQMKSPLAAVIQTYGLAAGVPETLWNIPLDEAAVARIDASLLANP